MSMWRFLQCRKLIKINYLLMLMGFINLMAWFFFGHIFVYKNFERAEIIFPLLILILNTIMALSIILFSIFLWEGSRNILFYINLLPSVFLLVIEFFIIYPNAKEIFCL